MRDDFAALDLFSADPTPAKKGKLGKKQKKKLFGLPRRATKSQAKRPLAALLPMLADKVKNSGRKGGLQGWPVTLSWPAMEEPRSDQDFH